MQGSKHAKRMIKVKVARAPQYEYNSPAPTQTAAANAPSASHSAVSSLPTSTAALAGVIAFLALALLLVLGTCFYRRRQRHARESKAPSATVDFNRDAFTEKKSAYSPSFDQHVRANISNQILESKSQRYQHSISESSESHYSEEKTLTWTPQHADTKFRVTNDTEGPSNLPAVPKRVAEKKRPSRSKPTWIHSLNVNPEDMARSPPPSYDIASGGQEFLIPIPAQLPPEKSKATPTPPTPPASRKSHRSSKRPFQNLVIPTPTEKVSQSIPSPARSASFAHKELNMPTPPVSALTKASSPPSSKNQLSPAQKESTDGKAPRLMNVTAPYTPTLSDELRVQVGDTVRVLQEYQDGWCFAQFVGKGDAPKGVIPLVCLEDRRRVVPVGHKTSNGSLSSLNSWR